MAVLRPVKVVVSRASGVNCGPVSSLAGGPPPAGALELDAAASAPWWSGMMRSSIGAAGGADGPRPSLCSAAAESVVSI